MQDENFNPVAQSRANYYTPGSPVQFVRVELLRGEVSGGNAVCLTFKNIGQETLTGLKIHFKCKDAKGEVLCEDVYSYEDVNAATGDTFGMEDAVFVTDSSIGSVDVVLSLAYYGRHSEALEQYKRVRLPAPKRLPKELAAGLQAQIGRQELKYMPQVMENGWYCACGAFHPNEENTVYCSECGSDRILLQNAISSLLEPTAVEEPTRVVGSAADEPTRVMDSHQQSSSGTPYDVGNTREIDREAYKVPAAEHFSKTFREEPTDDEMTDRSADASDVTAEAIIRWVPPITALVCAAIAFSGFIYCQFFV